MSNLPAPCVYLPSHTSTPARLLRPAMGVAPDVLEAAVDPWKGQYERRGIDPALWSRVVYPVGKGVFLQCAASGQVFNVEETKVLSPASIFVEIFDTLKHFDSMHTVETPLDAWDDEDQRDYVNQCNG